MLLHDYQNHHSLDSSVVCGLELKEKKKEKEKRERKEGRERGRTEEEQRKKKKKEKRTEFMVKNTRCKILTCIHLV